MNRVTHIKAGDASASIHLDASSRLTKACLACSVLLVIIFFCLFVSVFVSDRALSKDLESSGSFESTYTESIWQSVKNGADIESSMQLAGLTVMRSDDVPGWIAEEIIDPDNASLFYASSDMTVLGLSIEDAGEDAIDGFLSELVQKTWVVLDSGYSNVYTLVKEGGECRWMMLDVKRRGGDLNMVMHIRRN